MADVFRLIGFELRYLGAKLEALGKLEFLTMFFLFCEYLLIIFSLFWGKSVQLFRRYGPLKFYSFLLISNPYFGIRHCSWTNTLPMLIINYMEFFQYSENFLWIILTLFNYSRVKPSICMLLYSEVMDNQELLVVALNASACKSCSTSWFYLENINC